MRCLSFDTSVMPNGPYSPSILIPEVSGASACASAAAGAMHHVAATSAMVADAIANDVRFKDTLFVGPPQSRPRKTLSNDEFAPPAV